MHVEAGESMEDGVRRETIEEPGLSSNRTCGSSATSCLAAIGRRDDGVGIGRYPLSKR